MFSSEHQSLNMTYQKRKVKAILMSTALACHSGCGNTGSADSEEGYLGARVDVTGSITSQFGGQSRMSGWIMTAIEKDTGIARIGQVTRSGQYTFKKVFSSRTQTLALLTPDYVLSSVLTIPSTIDKTVKQFFNFTSDTLPPIIDKVKIINFRDPTLVSVTNDLASDVDGDGKPDGTKGLTLDRLDGGFFLLSPTINKGSPDVDKDGILNDYDPDIDGDGVLNWFDPDDDGDAVLDVLDSDANGDGVPDTDQAKTDAYFNEGIEWLSVQNELEPIDDETSKVTLYFTVKVRPESLPTSVTIASSKSLFYKSKVTTISESGKETVDDWDMTLLDDGNNEDGGANDGVWARKVALNPGKAPKPNQVVFIQLVYGAGDTAWSMDFPYTFPSITPEQITAQYDANTRSINLVGNPFGTSQKFMWSVIVSDADGQKIYSSDPSLGTKRLITLPAALVADSEGYTYRVAAQLNDKVAGFPTYISYSPTYNLE